VIGSLCAYIAQGPPDNFQPMNANLGLLPPLQPPIRSKERRHERLLARALETMDRFLTVNVPARLVPGGQCPVPGGIDGPMGAGAPASGPGAGSREPGAAVR